MKLRKFHLNPSIFNTKITTMYKRHLIKKKNNPTAFRSPMQNELMQTVNIFCTGNDHLHAFYTATKNSTNWVRASCQLFVSGKNRPLLLAKSVCTTSLCRSMMTSSNGKIFRVTGHLCGEFTGLRWIPRTKASDAELWCFLWSTPEWPGE